MARFEMTCRFHGRCVKFLACVVLLLGVLGSTLALAGVTVSPPPRFMSEETIKAFWDRTRPAHEGDLGMLGEWKQRVLGFVPLEKMRRASFEDVRPLFEEAVALQMSSLEFFADPAWREDRAVLMSRKDLALIDKHFNVRAVFLMDTRDTDGLNVYQEWLLLGTSQLILHYNRSGTVKHPDYPIYTGKFDYTRFFRTRVGIDERGCMGVFDVKGADKPGDELAWMDGPLDAALKNFIMIDHRKLRVEYERLLVSTDHEVALLPMQKRAEK